MTRGSVGRISVRMNVIRGANRCLGRALNRPNYIRAAWSFTRETSPSTWPSAGAEWMADSNASARLPPVSDRRQHFGAGWQVVCIPGGCVMRRR
jgi:hypothetical protein